MEWVRAWLGRVGVMKIAMKMVGVGSELEGRGGVFGVTEGFFFSVGLWPAQRSCSVTACGLHRPVGGFTVERTHSFFLHVHTLLSKSLIRK